jgi:hypothetical protein
LFLVYLNLFLLFSCGVLVAQTNQPFTLNVTPIAETCLGNGALKLSVTNVQPNVLVVYQVYKSGGDTASVATYRLPSSEVATANLGPGSYRVKAVLSTPGLVASAQQWEGAITKNWVMLTLGTPVVTHTVNGKSGAITVKVTSGKPVAFYTVSGPTKVAEQSSNVLTGLNAGTYVIAVKDACGNIKTRTVVVQ